MKQRPCRNEMIWFSETINPSCHSEVQRYVDTHLPTHTCTFSCCLYPYLLLHLYFIWLLYLDWSKNQSKNVFSNKLYGSSIISVYVTHNMRTTGLFLSHSWSFHRHWMKLFSWLLGPNPNSIILPPFWIQICSMIMSSTWASQYASCRCLLL